LVSGNRRRDQHFIASPEEIHGRHRRLPTVRHGQACPSSPRSSRSFRRVLVECEARDSRWDTGLDSNHPRLRGSPGISSLSQLAMREPPREPCGLRPHLVTGNFGRGSDFHDGGSFHRRESWAACFVYRTGRVSGRSDSLRSSGQLSPALAGLLSWGWAASHNDSRRARPAPVRRLLLDNHRFAAASFSQRRFSSRVRGHPVPTTYCSEKHLSPVLQ